MSIRALEQMSIRALEQMSIRALEQMSIRTNEYMNQKGELPSSIYPSFPFVGDTTTHMPGCRARTLLSYIASQDTDGR